MICFNLHKTLKGISGDMNLELELDIPKGDLVTLYGDSGAGKTSTLRMLSGLLRPDFGKISVNDDVWFDINQNINLSPQQRNIGYVFQDYALFPNMTIRENLEFALTKNQNNGIVSGLIDIVELGELQHRKPNTLSGGQQQRVALARALVQQPQLLLLDEPLAALDNTIRLKLQDYILKVHREYKLTTILISHDIGEIIKLSDKVYVLKEGQIIKQGTPTEVFINKKINDDLKVTGIVLAIEKQNENYEITLSVHSQIIKIKTTTSEIKDIKIGDFMVMTSEILNPKLYKINS
ncbi:ATP-binding cassette domain-containing protein [Flavobacteriaceae bacterium AU392]|nr:ATP-binding cassette domain-containing protein [Flavobacteriaceae bacterium]RKM85418.1 ATP-binding cassette domain-containing protein [Flavobacteriaceae bacterium AU392]